MQGVGRQLQRSAEFITHEHVLRGDSEAGVPSLCGWEHTALREDLPRPPTSSRPAGHVSRHSGFGQDVHPLQGRPPAGTSV